MAYMRDEQGNPIPHAPRRMTEKGFLAWTASEAVRVEWSDGIAHELVPPNRRHQEILSFLMCLLYPYVVNKDLGEVLPAGFEMRLRDGRSYRQPDLIFVAKEHKHRLGDGKRLDGPENLAVEIVGDDTADQDLRVKLVEYAESGVQEYWIIDPRPGQHVLRVFSLNSNANYEEIEKDDFGRIYSKVIAGFWVSVGWLASEPLHQSLEALIEIMPELAERFGQSAESMTAD